MKFDDLGYDLEYDTCTTSGAPLAWSFVALLYLLIGIFIGWLIWG